MKNPNYNTAGLELLAQDFPWPEKRPEAPTSDFGWGIGGAELIQSMAPNDVRCVVEIGTLLGSSARTFAEWFPDARIVCVDPWMDLKNRPLLEQAPNLAHWLNDVENGIYQVFLASNWDYRDRIIPVRGFSPQMLGPISRADVNPDFIYVDGSHIYEDVIVDLSVCHTLFPDALICGDDWNWEEVRRAVRYYGEKHHISVVSEGNTWVLQASPGAIETDADAGDDSKTQSE